MNTAFGSDASGFSLIEALVGTVLVTAMMVSGARLLMVSRRGNQSAAAAGAASVLAAQKMEQLRSLAWGFDASGQPTADRTSDLTVAPQRAAGGIGLTPSPSGALQQ